MSELVKLHFHKKALVQKRKEHEGDLRHQEKVGLHQTMTSVRSANRKNLNSTMNSGLGHRAKSGSVGVRPRRVSLTKILGVSKLGVAAVIYGIGKKTSGP